MGLGPLYEGTFTAEGVNLTLRRADAGVAGWAVGESRQFSSLVVPEGATVFNDLSTSANLTLGEAGQRRMVRDFGRVFPGQLSVPDHRFGKFLRETELVAYLRAPSSNLPWSEGTRVASQESDVYLRWIEGDQKIRLHRPLRLRTCGGRLMSGVLILAAIAVCLVPTAGMFKGLLVSTKSDPGIG